MVKYFEEGFSKSEIANADLHDASVQCFPRHPCTDNNIRGARGHPS